MINDFQPLEGRSKSKIIFDQKNNIVKKSEFKDIDRFRLQIYKQQNFDSLKIKNIKTPKILNVGKGYFEMEFINGMNFIQFVEDENIKLVNLQIENLLNYLNEIKKIRLNQEKNFPFKINEKIKALKIEKRHKEIYFFLKNQIERNNLNISSTYCHGDLSLSNLIFKEKDIYMVDFLNPFYDTYLMDIAKLRQDSVYFWLFVVNNFSSIKCEIVVKEINKMLINNFNDEISSIEFKVIELINFLRIEPYLKNKNEKKQLHKTIYNIFNSINK